MNKLYRSLVAGLAVIGLVGCGDDVTVVDPPVPPQPIPVITVTVAPNGVTIPVGGTVQLAAAVSGATGATIAWSTSSAAVATVSATGLVTGVAPGSAGITATATANGVTGAGSATITVGSATPATISINSITAPAPGGGPGGPVVLAAVAGQINVALNVERGGQAIQRVEVLIGNTVVGTQNFSLLANKAQEAGEEFDAIEVLTISVNTAAFNAITGIPILFNGPTTISAKLITAQNQAGIVSPSLGMTLANASGWVVTLSTPNSNSAVDAAGLAWTGLGDVQMSALLVSYVQGASTASSVTMDPDGIGALGPKAGPSAMWPRTGTGSALPTGSALYQTATPAAPPAPTITGSVLSNGQAGPTAVIAVNGILRHDNLPPAAPTVNPMPIWVNGAFTFNAGATAPTGVIIGSDGNGVGGVTAAFFVGAVTALPGTPTATSCSVTGLTEITAANETALPGTIVSTVYRGRVVTKDLLGNQTCAPLAPNGVSADPFGADYIAPTGTMTGPANGSAANATGASFAFAVADNASGFGATPLSGIIKRLNANNTTSCVFGSGTGCSVPGTSVLTLDAYNLSTTNGYYTFDPITVNDQAANPLAFTGRTYLLDQVAAAFSGGLSLQALYVGGATATFTTQATDNMDLNNVFGTLAYPTGTFQFPSQQIGTFGAPLEQAAAVNFAVANFMRCVNVGSDFATMTNKPSAVDLFLSDFAQAAPTAFGATTIPPANVENCGAVGNVTGIISFNLGAPVFPTGKTQVDISGTNMVTASSETVTLSAVADVPLNTSVDPFSRVDFYYRLGNGNWVLAGQGTATLSQTPTQRLWTYTFVWNPGSAVPAGAVPVAAVGVDSNGDAVFAFDTAALPPTTVTTVP